MTGVSSAIDVLLVVLMGARPLSVMPRDGACRRSDPEPVTVVPQIGVAVHGTLAREKAQVVIVTVAIITEPASDIEEVALIDINLGTRSRSGAVLRVVIAALKALRCECWSG